MPKAHRDFDPTDDTHVSDSYVICPWCGYRHGDAFEYKSGDRECVDCGNVFHVEVETTITFTTSKPKGGAR